MKTEYISLLIIYYQAKNNFGKYSNPPTRLQVDSYIKILGKYQVKAMSNKNNRHSSVGADDNSDEDSRSHSESSSGMLIRAISVVLTSVILSTAKHNPEQFQKPIEDVLNKVGNVLVVIIHPPHPHPHPHTKPPRRNLDFGNPNRIVNSPPPDQKPSIWIPPSEEDDKTKEEIKAVAQKSAESLLARSDRDSNYKTIQSFAFKVAYKSAYEENKKQENPFPDKDICIIAHSAAQSALQKFDIQYTLSQDYCPISSN